MPPDAGTRRLEPRLRVYLDVFRRRKGMVLLCVVLLVGATLVLSFLQTPVYEAKAEVLVRVTNNDSASDPAAGQRLDHARLVRTEIKILESPPVRDAVRRELATAPAVVASPAGQTDVINVRARSTDPKRAAAVANAYATSYIDLRRKSEVDAALAAVQQLQAKVSGLQTQIDALPGGPQRDALVSQQTLFKQKVDQLQVDAVLKTGGAQLVTNASEPTSPVKPRPVRNGVLALLVGLVVGTGLALLVDYLDDSVNTKEDLAGLAPDVPVLGLIPTVATWTSTDDAQVISLLDSTSRAAEAYRTLRTSVQFLLLEHSARTLQVTSASAGEGKTTTVANLGVALARAGLRVIIVCCDLRKPRVHDFFGLDNANGFTSVLLGKVPLTTALQSVPDQPRLSVLASGPVPPNPSELLSSKRTVEVLTSVQAECDIVLIDSPPVLPVTDGLVVSGRVDATLLVCAAESTTRKNAARAVELLRQVDAPLLGTVLNGVTAQAAYGDDPGYYRQPTSQPATNGKRASTKSRKDTTESPREAGAEPSSTQQ
jgi:succinoglycan biosynthesis transport protein ExoP